MIPTKKDIQARYLRGEINYDAYMKLLGRSDQEARRDAEEGEQQRKAARLDIERNKVYSSDNYKNWASKVQSNTPSPYSYYGKKK